MKELKLWKLKKKLANKLYYGLLLSCIIIQFLGLIIEGFGYIYTVGIITIILAFLVLTFDTIYERYYNPKKRTVQLAKLANDEEDWEFIYDNSPWNSNLKNIAKNKLEGFGYFEKEEIKKEENKQQIFDTAKTSDDYLEIYLKESPDSKFYQLAKEKLSSLGFFDKNVNLV